MVETEDSDRNGRGGEEGRARHLFAGFESAVEWLHEHHRAAVSNAFYDEYLGELGRDRVTLLDDLPEEVQQLVWLNFHEWLLADGELDAEGESESAADLVLGANGADLDDDQRRWIEAIHREPLKLWRVVEVRPGEGLELRDALDPEAAARPVIEPSADGLGKGELFAARLLPLADGERLSGALYPFAAESLAALEEAIADELDDTDDDPEEALYAAWITGRVLIQSWLDALTLPDRDEGPLPGDGDGPRQVFLDHYEVTDWERLAALLAGEEGVEGERQGGWTRLIEPPGGMPRAWSLMPQEGDRLRVFCASAEHAEEGREWLRRQIGDALRFAEREVVELEDP